MYAYKKKVERVNKRWCNRNDNRGGCIFLTRLWKTIKVTYLQRAISLLEHCCPHGLSTSCLKEDCIYKTI